MVWNPADLEPRARQSIRLTEIAILIDCRHRWPFFCLVLQGEGPMAGKRICE